jgi:hypothetical protein
VWAALGRDGQLMSEHETLQNLEVMMMMMMIIIHLFKALRRTGQKLAAHRLRTTVKIRQAHNIHIILSYHH